MVLFCFIGQNVILNRVKVDIFNGWHVPIKVSTGRNESEKMGYWPNIDKDISQIGSSCDAYRQRLQNQTKEEMLEEGY